MSEYMQEYRNFLNRIADASYSIDQSVTGLIDEASPIRAASEIQTTLGGIAQTAFNIKDKTEADGWAGVFEDYRRAIPFGSYIGTSSGSADSRFAAAEQAALDALDPEEVMKAQLYVRETVSDLRRVQDETEARRRYFEATPERALGLYRAREGDDLRYVSQLYYGTPTQWRALMLFNGLDTTELYPGQTITIPRIDQPEDEAQL
jgi:nucleoid-associated protein YgaU